MGNDRKSKRKGTKIKHPGLVQPRLVRGFRDLFETSLEQRNRMIRRIQEVYELYGFTPLETPALEPVDVLGKFLPDTDTPQEGIYALKDPDDDSWIAMRYDLTAPLARVFSMNRQVLGTPYRRYQIGPVYRYEKRLKPGRLREFYQVDFDTVGAGTMAADAEACSILADALEALGISRGDYRIRINNRKLLQGLLESLGLPETGGKTIMVNQKPVEQSLVVMRAMDKLDQLGIDGVVELLGKGRMDQSGDYTEGAGLDPVTINRLVGFLELGRDSDGPRCKMLTSLQEMLGQSPMAAEGIEEIREIDRILTATGFGHDRVVLDPTVVRGMSYYTGPVYEAELTFDIQDKKTGKPRRFGSVGGGGRYDGLVERFLGERIPATGASVGVDRLMAALEYSGAGARETTPGPVVVTVMEPSRLPDYALMASQLRSAGIRAEVYPSKGGIKKQMKYADRRRAPVAVIAGSDEFSRDEVTLKDLKMGRELSSKIQDREEWRKGQPAQVTVAREKLVQRVREMLQAWG
ncbi:MAG: histidine--tRNA ligase [Deltaproteobacteria bacterium]|nr:histidine--tRNA ligase [Deltaproteobacteria bacterium]